MCSSDLGEVAAKMVLDDDFVRNTVGEAPKPLEWSLRIGLAALIVFVGLILARRSEPIRDSETMR